MKVLKKCFLVFLSLILLAGALPVNSLAVSKTTQINLYSNTLRYCKAMLYSDYSKYKSNAVKFAIPGISDGVIGGVNVNNHFYKDYVPQGITYDEVYGRYYISAYCESKSAPTVIFMLSSTGAYMKSFYISGYYDHAGGLACDTERLYVASGLYIYYISLHELNSTVGGKNSADSNKIRWSGSISVNSGLCGVSVGKDSSKNKFSSCSYCTYFNGLLWFGEFSLNDKNQAGDKYPYRAKESYLFGVDVSNVASPKLRKVMTVPNKTQGVAFFKDSSNAVYLACSMSFTRTASSTLRFYRLNQYEWGSDNGEGKGKASVEKFVHKNDNIKSLTLPAMMEDVCIRNVNNKVYLVMNNESGAKEYQGSAITLLDCVSAMDIEACIGIKTAPQITSVVATGGVLTKLGQIAQKYPTGSYFSKTGKACGPGQTNGYCTYCQLAVMDSGAYNVCGNGDSCWAFANYVFYKVFGSSPKSNPAKSATPSNLNAVAQIGDFIQVSGHYFIYMGGSGNNFLAYESNIGLRKANDRENMVFYKQSHSVNQFSSYTVYHASNYGSVKADTRPPTILSVKKVNITGRGYQVVYSASDNVKLHSAWSRTYALDRGEADTSPDHMELLDNNTFRANIYVSRHGNNRNIYCTKVYVDDSSGNYTYATVYVNILLEHQHEYAQTYSIFQSDADNCQIGTTKYKCRYCNEHYFVNKNATAHKFAFEYEEAPTCTNEGYKLYRCQYCSWTYTEVTKAALGHHWGEFVSNGDATQEQNGTKTRVCLTCGEEQTQEDFGSIKTSAQEIEEITVQALVTEEIDVWWTSQHCDGYELEYSYQENFENAKKVTTSEPFYTIKGMSQKGTMYVRVRAFADSSGTREFGPWKEATTKVTLTHVKSFHAYKVTDNQLLVMLQPLSALERAVYADTQIADNSDFRNAYQKHMDITQRGLDFYFKDFTMKNATAEQYYLRYRISYLNDNNETVQFDWSAPIKANMNLQPVQNIQIDAEGKVTWDAYAIEPYACYWYGLIVLKNGEVVENRDVYSYDPESAQYYYQIEEYDKDACYSVALQAKLEYLPDNIPISDYSDFVTNGKQAAHEHNFDTRIVEGTCKECSFTLHHCVECGYSFADKFHYENNHQFTYFEVHKEPTCSQTGFRVSNCDLCGYGYGEDIPALNHDFESTLIEPTCTENGYTEYVCRRCGEQYCDNAVDLLGHDYQPVQQAQPDCTSFGMKKYVCSRCDDVRIEEMEPVGHNYSLEIEDDYAIAQDQTSSQTQYYYTCANCGGIDVSSHRYFRHTPNSITGKISLPDQHVMKVSLWRGDTLINEKRIDEASSGVFNFINVEKGVYSLRYGGQGALAVYLDNIVFESGNELVVNCTALNDIELCKGDVNDDGVIDIADISMILSEGFSNTQEFNKSRDVNDDGVVNILDLSTILLENNYMQTSKHIQYSAQ